jgi:hypothetical protein
MSNGAQGYQFQGTGNANQGWQNLLGGTNNTVNAIQNNPYAPGAIQGAQGFQQQGQQNNQQLQQMAAQNLGYGSQIMQTAFDPQQALYNQQLQSLTDSQNAQNAASGLASSPYAAGLDAQNVQNFNIGWQNQQLNRETQGANAYGALAGQAAGDIGQGFGELGASYNAPSNQYLSQEEATLGAQNSLGQDYQNFLGTALGYQNSYNQAQQQNFLDTAILGQGLGQGLGWLFGQSGGSGNFSDTNLGNIFAMFGA